MFQHFVPVLCPIAVTLTPCTTCAWYKSGSNMISNIFLKVMCFLPTSSLKNKQTTDADRWGHFTPGGNICPALKKHLHPSIFSCWPHHQMLFTVWRRDYNVFLEWFSCRWHWCISRQRGIKRHNTCPGRAGKLIEHWSMQHFHSGSTVTLAAGKRQQKPG